MENLLHITNGDSFTKKLQSIGVNGKYITWREMLSEGKTLHTVGSESFWRTRFEYLSKTYRVSKEHFINKTLKEYRNLCNHKKEDQIVLWFNASMGCQINMIAVISWLKTYRRYAEIFVVNAPSIDQNLNDIEDAELKQLFESKVPLSQDDIEFADYTWQLYCSDNPIRLENLSQYESFQLRHLSNTVEQHIKRFPYLSSGLNQVESDLLQSIANGKFKSREGLIRKFKKQRTYGLRSQQYERVLDSLSPLIKTFSPMSLHQKAMNILEGKVNFYSEIKDPDTYLGGALKYNFLYDAQSQKILKL
jgi:hypothetical protein